MERLIKDVGDAINANVAAIKWVDWDAGQLESPEDNYPVQFPCTLLDIMQAIPTRAQGGVIRHLVSLRIRVAIDVYETYHIAGGTESPDRATAFNKLSIVKDVLKVVHGLNGSYFSSLQLTNWQTEQRDDILKVVALDFQCSLDDYSAAKLYGQKQFTDVHLTKQKFDNVGDLDA